MLVNQPINEMQEEGWESLMINQNKVSESIGMRQVKIQSQNWFTNNLLKM